MFDRGLAAAIVSLAGGAMPATAQAEAGATTEVRLSAGFEVAAMDRWSYLRVDARHGSAAALPGTLTLVRESGATESVTLSVPPDQPFSELRYDYAGGPDRLASARFDLGGASATWERPGRIPPSRLLVIVTADEGRALPVTTLIGARKGLGLARGRPDSLPDRWAAWRRVTAVLGWADELPARSTAEGQALRHYVRAGGTLLLYPGDGGSDLFAELGRDATDVALGRGRILRMGRGGHLRPPPLTGPPPIDPDAPMLIAAPAAPPTGWLLARVGWFVPLILLGLATLRRRPAAGALICALTLVGAVVAADPPTSDPASVREARWAPPGTGYLRRELSLTPGRTGPLTLPADAATSVVALNPAAAISLTFAEAGTLVTPARWGAPIELLVESLAEPD